MTFSSHSSNHHYDVIIAGTGFASTFFLRELLQKRLPPRRILVLEKGIHTPHHSRVANREIGNWRNQSRCLNRTPKKPWNFSIGFGGGSNCWFGSTPRMLPTEFRTKTEFNAGIDWPISYDELHESYSEVEQIMQISGGATPYRMSRRYPLPPHRMSTSDQILRKANPLHFFPLPTARSSINSKRAKCCGNGTCFLCPIDSKFTIENGLSAIYEKSQVDIHFESALRYLNYENNQVSSVLVSTSSGATTKFSADLYALGTNAIFNPWLLLRSGIDTPQTGTGLCEQVGVKVGVHLSGMENQQGSSISTGWSIHDQISASRMNRSGFAFHTINRPMNLQLDPRSPLSYLELVVSIEDFRQPENRVIAVPNIAKPVIEYTGHSTFADRALKILKERITDILEPLPVKMIRIEETRPTESHIQCTTPMGTNLEDSVIDKQSIHHRLRNLILLGSGNFPTASPANPTLTISALSLLTAKQIGNWA